MYKYTDPHINCSPIFAKRSQLVSENKCMYGSGLRFKTVIYLGALPVCLAVYIECLSLVHICTGKLAAETVLLGVPTVLWFFTKKNLLKIDENFFQTLIF